MNLSETIQRLVPNACEDLLASIGFRANARVGGDVSKVLVRPQDYAAGIIDFAGESMTGRAVLLSTFDFFASSRPSEQRVGVLTPQSARDWIRVRDWTMELSNQFLGRMKNGLCTLGVVIETRLPQAVSGHALLVTVRERKGPHLLYATTSGHEVLVWFEAALNEAAPRGPRVDPLREGDAVCF